MCCILKCLWPLFAHLLELQASGFEVTRYLTLQPGLQLLLVPALTAEETHLHMPGLNQGGWGDRGRRVQGQKGRGCVLQPSFLD